MSKKSTLIIFIFILFIFTFFMGCNSKSSQSQVKSGLKIYNWSSGLGGVNENDLDKTRFSYSINITNENEKTILIKNIEPSVNETIKSKILSKETVVTVNKDIKPNETIEINGEIIIDTKGLTKSDILKFEPFIKGIKILTEETIEFKH